jgi:hypothetical protein
MARKVLTPEDVRRWIDAGACVCPYCGGEDVDYGLPEIDCGAYQRADCRACGATWHEGYTLDRLLPVDEKGDVGDFIYADADLPPEEYRPAVLRGLPVLVVARPTAPRGSALRKWDVFCREHREPAGSLLQERRGGPYHYFPKPELVASLGMSELFVEIPASEVEFETPAAPAKGA